METSDLKRKTAVIFAADCNYAIGVAITIMSIEDRSPNLADSYIVYYDSWDEKNIDFVKNISSKVIMISYTRKDFESSHPELMKDNSISSFISRYSYFKIIFYEYWKHLKEFDQVIFLDADLVIVDDLMPLKSIYNIGWRGDNVKMPYNDTVIDKPNGGVLIFNKELPIDKMKDLFIKHLLITHNDELSLAEMAYDLQIKVTNLPVEYNIGSYALDSTNTENLKIFHCVGRKKIWNNTLYQYMFPEYIPYIDKYKKYVRNISSSGIYKNRFSFVKSLSLYDNYSLQNIYIYNKNIKLSIDIVNNKYIYFYKDFENLYFQVRHLHNEKFRIYFKIDKENIFKFNNYIVNDLELSDKIIKYTYYKYNEDKCTYFIDCLRKDLSHEINEIISIFVYIIDKYNFNKNNNIHNE